MARSERSGPFEPRRPTPNAGRCTFCCVASPDRGLTERPHLPGLRSDRVRRQRVTDLLSAEPRPIVLVVAPAGFGKTTAVVDWLESTDHPVCWHTLEAHDDDLYSLFAGLAGAVGEIVGPGRLGALVSSPSEDSDVGGLLGSALVEDLGATPDSTVLVIEDLHHLTDGAAVSALRFAVEHLPETLTLAITSRSDPPFPIARLRAAGRVTELRAADLSFDRDESAALLAAVIGESRAADVVDRLNDRIEGWAIGLQLAALSLAGRPDVEAFVETFTGSDRYVAEYLLDEVVEREPPELRRFLMETSLVDELSAELCSHITGMQRCEDVLDDLVERNVFIVPIGPDRTRLRYHQLFLDLLRTRMQRTEPQRAAQVLRAAALWCEEKDQIELSARYWIRSGDLEHAADVAVRHAPALLGTGQIVRHRSLMRLFDDSFVEAHPELLLRRAWGNLFLEGSGLAGRDIAQLERVADEGFLAAATAQIELMQAIAAWFAGNPEACRSHSHHSLELLTDDDAGFRGVAHLYAGVGELVVGDAAEAERELDTAGVLARQAGNHYAAFSALVATGAVELRRGDLDVARLRFDNALDLVAEMPDGGRQFPLRGSAWLGRGLVALEQFDLATAAEYFRKALGDLRRTTAVDYTALAYRRWAETESLSGRHQEAADVIEESRSHLAEFGATQVTIQGLDACAVVNLVRRGNLDAARRLHAKTCSIPQRGLREFDHPEYERLAATVQLEIALNRPAAAEAHLTTMRQLADERVGARIELACLEAVVHDAAGRPGQAIEVLAPAVELAAASGWIRPFVAVGPGVVGLLARCRPSDLGRDLVRRFSESAWVPAAAETAVQALPDPLTTRELEVLGEIAAGFTNAQIAERLFISVGTTKRHIANIFMKLPASHRAEAVARGRAAGLLA